MTVIKNVTCSVCGDEHQVVCEHPGKECEYCGLTFRDPDDRREHEAECDYRDAGEE